MTRILFHSMKCSKRAEDKFVSMREGSGEFILFDLFQSTETPITTTGLILIIRMDKCTGQKRVKQFKQFSTNF